MIPTISNTDEVIDIRDVIERLEELESEFETAMEEVPDNERGNPDNARWREWDESQEAEELKALQSLMDDFKGYGGDKQWRGDWYPITLIRDDYFEDYTKELLEECGYIPKDFPSWIAIDWEETAEAVQQDYSSAEFDGVTYWAR